MREDGSNVFASFFARVKAPDQHTSTERLPSVEPVREVESVVVDQPTEEIDGLTDLFELILREMEGDDPFPLIQSLTLPKLRPYIKSQKLFDYQQKEGWVSYFRVTKDLNAVIDSILEFTLQKNQKVVTKLDAIGGMRKTEFQLRDNIDAQLEKLNKELDALIEKEAWAEVADCQDQIQECVQKVEQITDKIDTLKLNACVTFRGFEPGSPDFLKEAFTCPCHAIKILVLLQHYLLEVLTTVEHHGDELHWLKVLQDKLASQELALQSVLENIDSVKAEMDQLVQECDARLDEIARDKNAVTHLMDEFSLEEKQLEAHITALEAELAKARKDILRVKESKASASATHKELSDKEVKETGRRDQEMTRMQGLHDSLVVMQEELEEVVDETRKSVLEVAEVGVHSVKNFEGQLKDQLQDLPSLYEARFTEGQIQADYKAFVSNEIEPDIERVVSRIKDTLEAAKQVACQQLLEVATDNYAEEVLLFIDELTELPQSSKSVEALIKAKNGLRNFKRTLETEVQTMAAEESTQRRRTQVLLSEVIPQLESEQKEMVSQRLYRQAATKAAEIKAALQEKEAAEAKLHEVQVKRERAKAVVQCLDKVLQSLSTTQEQLLVIYTQCEERLRELVHEALLRRRPSFMEDHVTPLKWLGTFNKHRSRTLEETTDTHEEVVEETHTGATEPRGDTDTEPRVDTDTDPRTHTDTKTQTRHTDDAPTAPTLGDEESHTSNE